MPPFQWGDVPYGIAVTPLNQLDYPPDQIYVVNFGDDTVSVIDAKTNQVVATVPVGILPVWVAIAPDGSRAYVSNLAGHSLSVIDTATHRVVATIPAGKFPFGVTFNHDGSRIYVANQLARHITVIDANNYALLGRVEVGIGPFAIAAPAKATQVFSHK